MPAKLPFQKMTFIVFGLLVSTAYGRSDDGISSVSRTEDSLGNYQFNYDITDWDTNRKRWEVADAGNNRKGGYSITDVDGKVRHLEYVADKAGFRAVIRTNEPGTAPSYAGDALYVRDGVKQIITGAQPALQLTGHAIKQKKIAAQAVVPYAQPVVHQPIVKPAVQVYQNLQPVVHVQPKPVVYQQPVVHVQPKPVVYQQPIVHVQPKPVVYQQPIYQQPIIQQKPIVYQQPIVKPSVQVYQNFQPVVHVQPKPIVYQQPVVQQVIQPKPVVYQQPIIRPTLQVYQNLHPVVQQKPIVYQQPAIHQVVQPIQFQTYQKVQPVVVPQVKIVEQAPVLAVKKVEPVIVKEKIVVTPPPAYSGPRRKPQRIIDDPSQSYETPEIPKLIPKRIPGYNPGLEDFEDDDDTTVAPPLSRSRVAYNPIQPALTISKVGITRKSGSYPPLAGPPSRRARA